MRWGGSRFQKVCTTPCDLIRWFTDDLTRGSEHEKGIIEKGMSLKEFGKTL